MYVKVSTVLCLVCQGQYCIESCMSRSVLYYVMYVKVSTVLSHVCQGQYCIESYMSRSVLYCVLYVKVSTVLSHVCQGQYCIMSCMSRSVPYWVMYRIFLDARILRHCRNFQSNDHQNKIHCIQVDAICKFSVITTKFNIQKCKKNRLVTDLFTFCYFRKSTFILY